MVSGVPSASASLLIESARVTYGWVVSLVVRHSILSVAQRIVTSSFASLVSPSSFRSANTSM